MVEKKAKLTALIIVLNGERTIGSCLQSLAFCDNIVVIDSFSTDKTKKSVRNTKRFLLKTRSKAIWNKSGSVLTGYKKRPLRMDFFLGLRRNLLFGTQRKNPKSPCPQFARFRLSSFPPHMVL